jgi:sigma-B regulation protein RsbU (phosphoserine phosphatase)
MIDFSGGPLARRAHLIAAGVLFGLFFAYAGINAYLTLRTIVRSGNSGWLATQRDDRIEVLFVRPGGPAWGVLSAGDEVLALDGVGLRSVFDMRDMLRGSPPRAYRALIRRDGRLQDLRLRTVPFGVGWATLLIVTPAFVSFLFLLFGSAILLLKPDDRRARLLALMCSLMIFGELSYRLMDLPLPVKALLVVVPASGALFWPVFLHFFLTFPDPGPLVRRLPRLTRLIYLPSLALLIPTALMYAIYAGDQALAVGVARGSPPLAEWVLRTLPILYVVAGLAALVVNYRHASRPARRKLRVVLAGTLVGFGPLLCIAIWGYVTSFTSFSELLITLWFASFLALLLVPLSFAYAIVRHQVIPIRLIVRQGIRYLLVAKGFFVIEALVLLAALAFLLSGRRAAFLDGLGERADIAATIVVSVLVIGLLTLLHRRVMPWIDRRFFREEYDAQTVLTGLGDAVRRARSVDELLDIAAERVERALHPENLGVFLLDDAAGHYTCVIPREGGPAVLRADSSLVRELCCSPAPRETETGGLMLPIVTKGNLLGILSLGPRLGDLPYGRQDRRLLEAVAWQLAFAIENSRLVRSMVEEERLRRELTLASEVQRRLFPERAPALGALDLCGVCYPAQGVGGDYYDFLDLGEGRIGLAVADVAGKGISAALLMSIVQASLRSQARSADAALTELVASMNRLLYRSTARNSFASFFYARFDAGAGRLTYVNAGHNPPLLVRGNGGSARASGRRALAQAGGPAVQQAAIAERDVVEVLKSGGIVLGATEHATYEQESLPFAADDVLVAYTDGVTEAWSAEGEEFGEDRLREVVVGSRELPAREIADRVVHAVREWCREAPQADDLTLVVAKVR